MTERLRPDTIARMAGVEFRGLALDDLDSMPFDVPDDLQGDIVVREPRPCKHPKSKRYRTTVEGDGSVYFVTRCECGHEFDPSKQRRGKLARLRGKAIERKQMRIAGKHTGNANRADDGVSIDGMFAYQVKSRVTSLFPGWQQLELDKLRTAHGGKVPVLVVIEVD